MYTKCLCSKIKRFIRSKNLVIFLDDKFLPIFQTQWFYVGCILYLKQADKNLKNLVIIQQRKSNKINWSTISGCLVERAGVSLTSEQCQQRWQTYLNPQRISLPQLWSQEETQKLIKILQKYGPFIDKMSRIFSDRSKRQIKSKIDQILLESIKKFQKLLWKLLQTNFGVITKKQVQQMVKMMSSIYVSKADSDVFLLRKHLLSLMQKQDQTIRLNILQAQAYFIKVGERIIKQEQLQKKLNNTQNEISENSQHNFIISLYATKKSCKQIAMIYNEKTYEKNAITEKQVLQILREYLIKGVFHLIFKIESRSLNKSVSWANVMRKHTFTKMIKCIEARFDINSQIIAIKNQKQVDDQTLKKLLNYIKLFVDREALEETKSRTWKKNPVTQIQLRRLLNKQLRAMKYDIISQ